MFRMLTETADKENVIIEKGHKPRFVLRVKTVATPVPTFLINGVLSGFKQLYIHMVVVIVVGCRKKNV